MGNGFSKSNIGYENYGFSYLRKYVEGVKGLPSPFVFLEENHGSGSNKLGGEERVSLDSTLH